jgi:hypothetical protein
MGFKGYPTQAQVVKAEGVVAADWATDVATT